MRVSAIFFCLFALATTAHADLRGQPILPTSTDTGAATVSGMSVRAAKMTTASAYTERSVTLSGGTIEREYINAAGTVFAVTWNGPFMPDLQSLFGQTAYDQYVAALQTAQANTTGRRKGGPVALSENGLNVQITGHQRAIAGRAYVPSLLPSGVTVDALQ